VRSAPERQCGAASACRADPARPLRRRQPSARLSAIRNRERVPPGGAYRLNSTALRHPASTIDGIRSLRTVPGASRVKSIRGRARLRFREGRRVNRSDQLRRSAFRSHRAGPDDRTRANRFSGTGPLSFNIDVRRSTTRRTFVFYRTDFGDGGRQHGFRVGPNRMCPVGMRGGSAAPGGE
jgi:hypothetical protein